MRGTGRARNLTSRYVEVNEIVTTIASAERPTSRTYDEPVRLSNRRAAHQTVELLSILVAKAPTTKDGEVVKAVAETGKYAHSILSFVQFVHSGIGSIIRNLNDLSQQ